MVKKAGRRRAYSPQEKKELSYDRDGRPAYGQTNKGSRRVVPRRKRQAARSNRRAEHVLGLAEGVVEPTLTDTAVDRLEGRRPKQWIKSRDATLREWVTSRLERRARLGIDDQDSWRHRSARVVDGQRSSPPP